MSNSGVQYVSGMPQAVPVLRPIRTALYDREPVGGTFSSSAFFANNRQTFDGRYKDQSFTNMTQSGQLGTPLEFDLCFLSIRPVAGDPAYVDAYEQFIWSPAVLSWTWRCYRLFSQALPTLRIMGPVDDLVIDKDTGEAYKLVVKRGRLIPTRIPNYHKTGMVERGSLSARLVSRIVNMTTPDRKARRIWSTDSFCGKIECQVVQNTPAIDVYLAMDGILYATL